MQGEDTQEPDFEGIDNTGKSFFKANIFQKMYFGHIKKVIVDGVAQRYNFKMLYELDETMMSQDCPKFNEFFEQKKGDYEGDFMGLVFSYLKSHLIFINVTFFIRYVFMFDGEGTGSRCCTQFC